MIDNVHSTRTRAYLFFINSPLFTCLPVSRKLCSE